MALVRTLRVTIGTGFRLHEQTLTDGRGMTDLVSAETDMGTGLNAQPGLMQPGMMSLGAVS